MAQVCGDPNRQIRLKKRTDCCGFADDAVFQLRKLVSLRPAKSLRCCAPNFTAHILRTVILGHSAPYAQE
jgi:hypothetical protein